MLHFLADFAKRRPLRNDLIVFGPFIIDCANAWTVRHGRIPRRSTMFTQRVTYFEALRLTENSGAWYSGTLEAANSTLGNLLEVALTSACQLARKESEFDFAQDIINDVLQYIRAELGDIDLHSALRTLNESFQGTQTDHTTVEGQLITRLFHRLRCVLLLHTVLEAPSIHEGFTCPKAGYIGRKVISFCRTQAIRRDGPIEDYYLISWHNFGHLLLGGVAISRQECPERKFLFSLRLMEVCEWVVEELGFIGKEECARSLEEYWREGDGSVLARILEYAQFPEQMMDQTS